MKLKSLEIAGFRGISDLDLEFPERVNVLVGVNGAGKSAVLDCAAIMLSHLLERIRSPTGRGRAFVEHDITNSVASRRLATKSNCISRGPPFTGVTVRGLRERIGEHTTPTGEALGNDRSVPRGVILVPKPPACSTAASNQQRMLDDERQMADHPAGAAPARATCADSSRCRWPAASRSARRATPRRPAGSTGTASRCAPAPLIPEPPSGSSGGAYRSPMCPSALPRMRYRQPLAAVRSALGDQPEVIDEQLAGPLHHMLPPVGLVAQLVTPRPPFTRRAPRRTTTAAPCGPAPRCCGCAPRSQAP